jgi:predicted ester cyclase
MYHIHNIATTRVACQHGVGPVSTNAAAAEANIELIRGAFEAMKRRDLDACVGFLEPGLVINLAGAPYPMRGARAWRKNAEILFSAFPDIQIHVEDMFAAGDKVAVRARLAGTHTGDFLGKRPTGKRIDYQSNEFYRIADGKIAEEWICSDMLTMMAQIDAIPSGHLLSLWLAGYRVWFGAGLGVAVGVLAMLLLRIIAS